MTWTLIMIIGLAGVPLGTHPSRDACTKNAKTVYSQTVVIDSSGVVHGTKDEGHMSLAAMVCIPTAIGGK